MAVVTLNHQCTGTHLRGQQMDFFASLIG